MIISLCRWHNSFDVHDRNLCLHVISSHKRCGTLKFASSIDLSREYKNVPLLCALIFIPFTPSNLVLVACRIAAIASVFTNPVRVDSVQCLTARASKIVM